MEVEAALPLPVLREVSALMEEHHLKALSNHMVSAAVGHDWSLIYSTFKHGISLRTLYRNMALSSSPESPVLLLVRDDQHKLFGAALTVPLKLSETFYGTGESYLFSFESATDLKIYPWTGVNNYIVKGNTDSICIGCERGHAGLWLDDRLLNGSSEECSTFGNTCLSTTPEFTCTGVEAWGFL